jgi:hypothetical protein
MTFHDKSTSSRREILSLGAATGVMGFLGAPGVAYGAAHDHETVQYSLSVRTFGAAGDAATDDTAAFQRALDAAHASGGGVVYGPPGRYLFKGVLEIPAGVGLRGSFQCGPSSALFVTTGRGSEDGKPFLTLNTNSTVSGLTFYHP